MNPVSRGIRNAFRNGVRSTSIVLILGLTIGLSLTMLIAQKAVDSKIASVKSSLGNTVSISPTGFTPGSTQNNALTSTELAKVAKLAHVSSVTQTLTDRLSTTGSTTQQMGGPGGRDTSNTSTTSLTSPVTFGGGPRFMSGGTSSTTTDSTSTTTFSLPVSFLGTTETSKISDNAITIKSGKTISGTSDTDSVLVSEAMATKNNLSVGSTFTAYDTTLTVAGIFTTSTESAKNTVVMSLASLQRLSGQSGVVTSAIANVDSLDNLASVTSAIKSTLGTNTADVTSAEDQANQTVEPLNSVKKVTTFSLIGAIIAGAVIILLVMIMIVRERKREIGVVKAIGGSNVRIVGEFMVEALTLAILGAVIGLIIGVVGGQPVTKQLVSSNTSSSTTTTQNGPGGMGGPGNATGNRPSGFGEGIRRNGTVQSLTNIKTQIGWQTLLEGFGAAVFIAVLGSALAAGMIARVRPSTVMRAD